MRKMAAISDEIFSAIPLPTWRWLGVNEAKVPAGIKTEETKRQSITVAAGQQRTLSRQEMEGASELQITLEPGAEFALEQAVLLTAGQSSATKLKVTVSDGAKFSYTGAYLGGAEAAAALEVELLGRESQAEVWALYLGDDSNKIDLNYIIRQQGRSTKANMQVRGALLTGAEKIFRGTLDFLQGAKGSVGRENEEVLCLSDDVRNRSVPLMLSHEDEVDGHHAVSVGQMDEEKLFYLMSRGLSAQEARQLMVTALLQPVLDRFSPDLREKVRRELEGRLAHE